MYLSRSVRESEDYGYLNGDFMPGSGHLRVSVSSAHTKVDFVKAVRSSGSQIAHSYTMAGRQWGAAP